ncbi:MAG TPA: DNA alkylation repair protein [bacterium]|nr:DNA alkylation repair protein [bacterium]HPN43971.1 DNA alkylation repair protein [bacterium]
MSQSQELDVIAASIRRELAAHGNEAIIKKYAKFFTEGYDAYGIDKDIWESLKTAFQQDYQFLGLERLLELGDMLLQSGKYEEASTAIILIQPFADEYTVNTFNRIGAWLRTGVRNWAHSDMICGALLLQFIKRNIITLADFSSWKESPGKWQRRAVPVAMLEYLKRQPQYSQLLSLLDSLMHDPDRVVHQGLGWFLREAWKKNPPPVEEFLLRYKDTAPRLIFQYATEKMTAEQKQRFKRSK